MTKEVLEFKKHRLKFVLEEMKRIRAWIKRNKSYGFISHAKEMKDYSKIYNQYKQERKKLLEELVDNIDDK